MKANHSDLGALMSIRSFSKALEKHNVQIVQIDTNLNELNINALSIINIHCSPEAKLKCQTILKEIDNSWLSLKQVFLSSKEKISKIERSDSFEMWKEFNLYLSDLKNTYENLENFGFEILPANEHLNWGKAISNFEKTILPSLVSHAVICRVELQLIEKYTPNEMDKINQIIDDHIPEDFTFSESKKYEKDYLVALGDFKKEFREDKNLWDKFLDILAGGTHQSPSEHIMMQRWLDGEKDDL